MVISRSQGGKRSVFRIPCGAMCSNVRHTTQNRFAGSTREVTTLSPSKPAYTERIANSDLISRHEVMQLLDEEMKEDEVKDLLNAEDVCRRFLDWDLDDREGVDVKRKLRWVLGIADDDAGDG
jgi:hypothetical protein